MLVLITYSFHRIYKKQGQSNINCPYFAPAKFKNKNPVWETDR